MKVLSMVSLAALMAMAAIPANGDTINIGRSDVKLTVPKGYSKDSPAPLIVALHGYTSTSAQQEAYMKFGNLIDEFGFLLLTPDGTRETSGDKHPFWNANAACCDFLDSNVDDSGYLRDLVEEVKKKYAVDENRIYFFGHSNGGFMSHRMAYDHPDLIAAIATLNGASLPDMTGPAPQRPVNILHIHGTKDRLNNYEGGDINGNPYPGANETAEHWAAHNGAELKKKELRKKLDLDKRLEGEETTITQFDKSGTIELWTINGGGHVPAFSEDFTRHIVEWLYAHPKRAK